MRITLFFLACFMAVSCRPARIVSETHTQRDTLRVIEVRERLVTLPPAEADTVIRFVSLPVNVPVYVQDSTSQARLRLLRTQYDELIASCESAPDPVVVRDTVYRDRIRTETVRETETRKNRWGAAENLLLILGLLVFVGFLLSFFRR